MRALSPTACSHATLAAGNGKLPTAPVESAKIVGLRYVSDEMPGFRRQKEGRGFRYVDTDGKTIRDSAHLARMTRYIHDRIELQARKRLKTT